MGTAFERDQERMLRLLREIDARIAEVRDDNSLGDIFPLVRELEHSELSVKLGFFGQPVIFEERRDNPEYEVERALLCNDPYGTRGEVIQISGVLRSSHLDPIATRPKGNDRQRLRRVLSRWIRAVEALEEPEVYPASPDYFVPGVPRELWADALWRQLYFTVSMFEQGLPPCWGPEHGFGVQSRIDKINQLVRELGMRAHVPFGRPTEPVLIVFRHDGTRALVLDYDGEGGLREPNADDLALLVTTLRGWQDERKKKLTSSLSELDPALVEPIVLEPGSDELPDRVTRAWLLYRRAEDEAPRLKGATLKAIYDWLQCADGVEDLPKFETWCRYIRKARHALGQQKNKPGQGHSTRSVVRSDQV